MVKVSRSIEMAMLTYVADCKVRVVFMLCMVFFLSIFLLLSHIHFTATKSSIE